MVNLEDMHVGDVVQIVSQKGRSWWWNNDGLMDQWLGQIMTVKAVYESPHYRYVKMYEDETEYIGDGWYWYPEMIDHVVCKKEDTQFEANENLEMLF